MANSERKAKPHLLITDDEPEIRAVLSELLSDDYTTAQAGSGEEAVEVARRDQPDLVILDIMMPGIDGIQTLELLRNDPLTRHIPVMMLTAANQKEQRVNAFNLGADDFLSKPFDSEELFARISSKIRRLGERATRSKLRTGNLRIEKDTQLVYVDDTLVQLTAVEAGILRLLVQSEGEIVNRAKIMLHVWKDQNIDDRVIDAHMTSLRNKVKNANSSIKSIYKKGYVLLSKSS